MTFGVEVKLLVQISLIHRETELLVLKQVFFPSRIAVNTFHYTRYEFNMFNFQSRLHQESGICIASSLTGLWFPQLLICQL